MEREKAIKILEHTKNEMVATFADDPHAYWAEQIEALSMAIEAIKESATAEVTTKLLRCRDCKFLRFTGTVWKCQNRLVMMLCEPNDYCSRGERKEE